VDKSDTIIDGVEVCECEHFDYSSTQPQLYSECKAFSSYFPEGAFYDYCNEHPHCYYKQLKKKEKECQMYASINEKDTQGCAILTSKYFVLAQTIEKIKNILDEVNNG
jgi:hypothetical protein